MAQRRHRLVVHPTASQKQLNWDDRIIPRYQRIAELVHEFPVPVMAQLTHSGRKAGINQRHILDGNWLALAPSAVPTPAFGYVQAMPHEMTINDVEDIVDAFGQAAKRVRRGGLDGVEVMVGSYDLIAQFLHGQSNRRTDKYGGTTFEDRSTFMMEVLEHLLVQILQLHHYPQPKNLITIIYNIIQKTILVLVMVILVEVVVLNNLQL